ncbi:hypothetical protein PPERSA_07218 [Pseudocohnilembus persalinus]|uniref:Exocyst complex component Sec6 n=1 Tax=Pseudocohnilembus persalinus TaxID=266149 RepID=A0A0V0QD17_PSEPJ|nr:hypothetical protein PPERSA_07218 [Pseudocohnilembus persalinus]|eukprot:KRX00111.1 hypothetical protein PPERSA_07218 [Pseudocohnilembus persalinus]
MKHVNEEINILDENWQADYDTHQEMELFQKLANYKKNIDIFIEQLKYFMDVKFQIQRMEEKFQKEDFQHIFFKLISLTQLRDNVIEQLNPESKDLQTIKEEFKDLNQFEIKFYSALYGKIADCINLEKENPLQLMEIVKIVRNGDKLLVNQGKAPKFVPEAEKEIARFIEQRYLNQMASVSGPVAAIDNQKFIVQDLIKINSKVASRFPHDFDIFNLYFNNYKKMILGKLVPMMDQCETSLSRAGRQDVQFNEIRDRIQGYMAPFMVHLKDLIQKYIETSLERDKQDFFNFKILQKMIKEKQPLESNFPEDIFKQINDQIGLVVSQLKNDNFIGYIEMINLTFIGQMEDEIEQLKKVIKFNFEEAKKDVNLQLDLTLKISLYINNFQRCIKYSLETKKYVLESVKQPQQIEKVEESFRNLSQFFRNQLGVLYEQLKTVGFIEIQSEIIPQLFKQKWVDSDLIKDLGEKLVEFFDIISLSISLESQLWNIQKISFQFLADLYFEAFIMSYKNCFPNICTEFYPKYCDYYLVGLTEDQNLKGKANKQQKQQKQQQDQEQSIILMNKELMSMLIARDQERVNNDYLETYEQNLGKTASLVRKQFKVFLQIIDKKKIEIENLIVEAIQTYKLVALPLLEIGLTKIRDDCDTEYKNQMMKRMKDLLPKYLDLQQ